VFICGSEACKRSITRAWVRGVLGACPDLTEAVIAYPSGQFLAADSLHVVFSFVGSPNVIHLCCVVWYGAVLSHGVFTLLSTPTTLVCPAGAGAGRGGVRGRRCGQVMELCGGELRQL
jgi:hypothetical protein